MAAGTAQGKVFLLGIGCQKGGTSWLYHYLAHHPEVATGFDKELHVLDSHFRPEYRGYHDMRIAQKLERIEGLRRLHPGAHAATIAELEADIAGHRRSQQLAADLRRYVDYFVELAARSPEARLVCDITPSYCLLDGAQWQEVRRLLEAAGFDPRVAFTMRDPVDRMQSAYQMGDRAAAERTALLRPRLLPRMGLRERMRALRQRLARSPDARARHDPFLRFAFDEINLHRSQYDRTIVAVEQAFPPEKVHYAFFEDFFGDAPLRRFTDFVGLRFIPGGYATKRKSASNSIPLTGFQAERLRARLEPTYAFCAERFGRAYVERLWRHL